MSKKKITFLLILMVLLFQDTTLAETILFKSGKSVEGEITEKTDKYIKIDFQGASLTYYFDEIESINGKKLNGYSQVVFPDMTKTETVVKEYIPETIKKVTFDFGPEHMVAELEPKSKIVRLINGGSSSEKNRYFFAVLSMDQVNMLNSKYGGYRNWATCNSAGAGEGQSSISTEILITKDPVVENKLEQLLKLAFNSPVVEITGSKLKMVEYTYDKIKAAFATPMVYYLVSDIKVIQSRYP